MSRDELKEVITRIIDQMQDVEETPAPGCIFHDSPCDATPCDATTKYAIGEEG
jgi:hypothetical protein